MVNHQSFALQPFASREGSGLGTRSNHLGKTRHSARFRISGLEAAELAATLVVSVIKMSIAPEPILRAGNDTVSWACIFCRNQTLQDGAPTKMINDAMEVIHEVPRMLIDWERHDLEEVRTHLAGFPASRWPGTPNLVSYFDRKLKECGYGDAID